MPRQKNTLGSGEIVYVPVGLKNKGRRAENILSSEVLENSLCLSRSERETEFGKRN